MSIFMIIMCSFIFFLISFLISFQSNLFLDALIRSVVVFIITFAFLYLFQKIVGILSKQNSVQNSIAEINSSDEGSSVDQKVTEDDSLKGTSIDLTTPEEESEFKPFKPRNINELDD
jgi:hypothetical protein